MARLSATISLGRRSLRTKFSVRFAPCGLIEVDDRDRNVVPAEDAACLKPPLARDKTTLRGDDNRMQQANFADTVDKRAQVAQILAIAESDLDLINIHAKGIRTEPGSLSLRQACNRKG